MPLVPKPISKAAAVRKVAQFNARFFERCFSQVDSNSSAGIVGGTIPYGSAGAGAVTAAVTALQAAGWTVTRDDANSQLIVS